MGVLPSFLYFVLIDITCLFSLLNCQINNFDNVTQNGNPLIMEDNKHTMQSNNDIKVNSNETNNSTNNCFNIRSCYECATINECYWCNLTSTCENYNETHCKIENRQYVKNVETSDLWFLNYYYMCDTIKKCGEISFDLSSGNINVELNKNLNKYDACFWDIENKNKDNYTYSIYRQGPGKDKVAFANFQTSMYYSYQFDSSITNSYNINEEAFYEKVIFYQYFDIPLNNYFKLTMEIKLSGSSSALKICMIVISSMLAILLLILVSRCICINCCLRRNSLIDETGEILNEEEIPESNIEDLLNNFREAKSDECAKTDQINCTICLLPNDGKEKIVELPCHHYFHFNCISGWVKRKNIKPTCPNCNYDLLSNAIVPIPQGFFNNNKPSKNNFIDNVNNRPNPPFEDPARNLTEINNNGNRESPHKYFRNNNLNSYQPEIGNDYPNDSSHNILPNTFNFP